MAIWSDINANFGQNGLPLVIQDDNDIEGAIYNILTCPIGTRAWYPTFGSQLPFLLWEPVGTKTAIAIRVAAIQAIQKWESRVQVLGPLTSVTVNASGTGYYVTIGYVVLLTGTTGSVTYQFVK